MRYLLFVLLGAVSVAMSGLAFAHNYASFSAETPAVAVNYYDGYYDAPGPTYVEPRSVYVHRYSYAEPRYVRPRHVCPRGYRYVPGHYNPAGYWRPSVCQHW